MVEVSIHAPREGCDVPHEERANTRTRFQFTHPGRGATIVTPYMSECISRFQFTHPGRGATYECLVTLRDYQVSIHAPREGCDFVSNFTEGLGDLFQFTHPGRGATVSSELKLSASQRFNSRTPGGVRRQPLYHLGHPAIVSIHAPREGCDVPLSVSMWIPTKFQFTHPGRGATGLDLLVYVSRYSFNSRTPGGVRLIFWIPCIALSEFQFTHPGRGATPLRPHRGRSPPKFQFTHPGRGATTMCGLSRSLSLFQFTHPGRGATLLFPSV